MAKSTSVALAMTQQLRRLLASRTTLTLLSALLLLALAGWSVIWISKHSIASTAPSQLDKLHLTHVALQSIGSLAPRELEHQFYGIVQARRTVDLSAKFSERLSALLVDVGAPVVAGQPIVELEKRDHLNALAIAQAELAVVEAKLSEMVCGPREEELASARAAVEERSAMAQLHRSNYERLSRSNLSMAVSLADVENAKFMAQASNAQFEQAQQHLAQLEAGTRAEHIASQRALLTAQQARVSQLEASVADCTLVAPFDGKVQKRWIDEGVLVAPLQPIVTIVESQVMEVHVGLPPAAAEWLQKTADTPTIVIQISGRTYQSELSSLAPALAPETGTLQAIFRLRSEGDMSCVSGQAAELWLRHRPENGQWVPLSALISLGHGMWGLWIAQPTNQPDVFKVEHRPVKVLTYQSDWVLLETDLAAHELFVAKGTSRLSPGEYVHCYQEQPSS